MLETLNKDIGQIGDGAIYVKGGVIAWVGPTKDLPRELTAADTVLSLADHVVIPGTCQHPSPHVSVPDALHCSGAPVTVCWAVYLVAMHVA